jgi:hypothetical protein
MPARMHACNHLCRRLVEQLVLAGLGRHEATQASWPARRRDTIFWPMLRGLVRLNDKNTVLHCKFHLLPSFDTKLAKNSSRDHHDDGAARLLQLR